MTKRLCVLALVALTGCAGFTIGGGTPDEQITLAAGDAGAAACLGLALEGTPEQIAQAEGAVSRARGVLAAESPTFAALKEALSLSRDPKVYRAGQAVVRRIQARTGPVELLPKDSQAYAIAVAVISGCADVLG